jgi:hypothetical protein
MSVTHETTVPYGVNGNRWLLANGIQWHSKPFDFISNIFANTGIWVTGMQILQQQKYSEADECLAVSSKF